MLDRQLPSGGGAYGLILKIDRPIRFESKLVCGELSPGIYVYAGNANGPGGIRARLRRHARPLKRIRWHVDQLTVDASRVAAAVIPGADECDVVAWVQQQPGASFPLPGFGSSDCKRCCAHLLLVAECPDWAQLPGVTRANITQLRPALRPADAPES